LGLDWLEGWEQKRHPRVEGGWGRGGQSDLKEVQPFTVRTAAMRDGSVRISLAIQGMAWHGWAEGKRRTEKSGEKGAPRKAQERREERRGFCHEPWPMSAPPQTRPVWGGPDRQRAAEAAAGRTNNVPL
jgi:hypothetical protein